MRRINDVTIMLKSQNKKNKYSVDNDDDKGESDVDKNNIKYACSTVDIFNGCF